MTQDQASAWQMRKVNVEAAKVVVLNHPQILNAITLGQKSSVEIYDILANDYGVEGFGTEYEPHTKANTIAELVKVLISKGLLNEEDRKKYRSYFTAQRNIASTGAPKYFGKDPEKIDLFKKTVLQSTAQYLPNTVVQNTDEALDNKRPTNNVLQDLKDAGLSMNIKTYYSYLKRFLEEDAIFAQEYLTVANLKDYLSGLASLINSDTGISELVTPEFILQLTRCNGYLEQVKLIQTRFSNYFPPFSLQKLSLYQENTLSKLLIDFRKKAFSADQSQNYNQLIRQKVANFNRIQTPINAPELPTITISPDEEEQVENWLQMQNDISLAPDDLFVKFQKEVGESAFTKEKFSFLVHNLYERLKVES